MNYFEKNLKLLEKKQPDLAEQMMKAIDTSHIEVLASKTGIPSARVTTPEGEKVLLHDLEDPIARAQEHVKRFDLIGNNGSVLLGFGLGHLGLEIVKSMDAGHLLIICETDPGIFKVALEQIDLEPILKSTRVKILLGKDVDISTNLINLSVKFLTSKISVVRFNPSLSLDRDTYNTLERKIKETAVMIRVNANTLLQGGEEMSENILANTPDIIRSAGVKRLFNKLKDIPAIVVGAGPSLEKNVVLLKEVNERAVIIAVDRALGLLLPLGITPHLVPSIDFSKMNYDEKYSSIQINRKLFLVFCQSIHHRITKTFWGPKFVMNLYDRLSSILSLYWGDKGDVSTGLHVGHLAFCLAKALGCNPIILVGMDLAFTEDKIHASDVETEIKYTPSEYFASEGIFGDTIKSDAAFRSFVISLNEAIQSADALCIDATEGGAKKEGSKIMRLRDALDEYCQNDHPEIQKILEEESSKCDPARYDELVRDLKYAGEESKKMKRVSQSVLKMIKQLRNKKENGQEGSPEYISLSHKVEKMTIKAAGKGGIMSMLSSYNFPNILFMGTDEVRRIDEIEDPFEKLDRQLDRAETYYTKFIKALNLFIQDIQQLSKRLIIDRNAKEIFENSPKKWNDYLKYGLELVKTENYTDAETAFKKVIDLRPNFSDAYYHLGKIYSEQNRFETAIPVLKQAIALKNNLTKAKNLLRRCQENYQQWQERCKKLREKFFNDTSKERDEKEIILEAGNFYFWVKDYERAEKEYLKVINQHPTLPEAHYHLGHTYFAMKDFDRGVEALSSALELTPNNPVIYRDLGLVSIDRGLVNSAEGFLLKAIELKPDDFELKELLGNIYFNNRLFDKAILLYEEIVKTNPRHQEATKNLSLAYQSLIKGGVQAKQG